MFMLSVTQEVVRIKYTHIKGFANTSQIVNTPCELLVLVSQGPSALCNVFGIKFLLHIIFRRAVLVLVHKL